MAEVGLTPAKRPPAVSKVALRNDRRPTGTDEGDSTPSGRKDWQDIDRTIPESLANDQLKLVNTDPSLICFVNFSQVAAIIYAGGVIKLKLCGFQPMSFVKLN